MWFDHVLTGRSGLECRVTQSVVLNRCGGDLLPQTIVRLTTTWIRRTGIIEASQTPDLAELGSGFIERF